MNATTINLNDLIDRLVEACNEVLHEAKHPQSIPPHLRTKTDDLDKKSFDELLNTPEYLEFRAEYDRRIRELSEFVEVHRPEYNCSLLIIGTTATSTSTTDNNPNACRLKCHMLGRVDTLKRSIAGALTDETFDDLITGQVKRKLILELMRSSMFTDGETSDGETTGEPDTAEPTSAE